MTTNENELIITYTAMDKIYLNGNLMYIAGRENAGTDDLGTIVAPVPAGGVSIENDVPDPVLFSYYKAQGENTGLRVALVNIYSKGGESSTCTVSVYKPSVDEDWKLITKDVTFVDVNGSPILFNPRGMADSGDKLCFIDYETRGIAVVGEDALEAADDGSNLHVDFIDLSRNLSDTNAKGQAIIALGGKIYALYISADTQAENFGDSQLFRLGFNAAGELAVEAQTIVGVNAQSIIPVKDGGGKIWLLIPAIGGRQLLTGATWGTDSNICVVGAEDDWVAAPAVVKLTGDPMPEPTPGDPTPSPTAYNIMAVGAAMRTGSSKLFILTQVYNDDAANAFWELYRTTVADFLAIDDGTAISAAASLELIDEGIVQAGVITVDPPSYYSVYFWDLLYEQSDGDSEAEDRLWAALGSPILVTKPAKYSSPGKPDGPFIMYSCIGGENVNSMDAPIETLHQALRGKLSLKRGLRGPGQPAAVAAAGEEGR
ncbi:MAG: hypothetical protein LBC53_04330 [Spirochaetaceae bacterium]|jgi:hypothetical protein|nr:hypothetical protein [Spirochaetaceae bacterium]